MNCTDACRTGNLDWLKQRKAAGKLPKLTRRSADQWYPHELATVNGHLEVLKWLLQDSGQCVDLVVDSDWLVCAAAESGHLDVIRWVIQESGQSADVTAFDNWAIRGAAKNGHLDIVRWLVEDYSDWLAVKKLEDPFFTGQPVDVTARDNDAVRSAVSNGHTAVVGYLRFVTPIIAAVGLDGLRSSLAKLRKPTAASKKL